MALNKEVSKNKGTIGTDPNDFFIHWYDEMQYDQMQDHRLRWSWIKTKLRSSKKITSSIPPSSSNNESTVSNKEVPKICWIIWSLVW